MPTNHRRPYRAVVRSAALVLVTLWAAGLAFLTGVLAGPADAAPFFGSEWGAQKAPYLDGVICENRKSGISTPLVAWDLGNDLAPAFLISGVTSDGKTDSGRIPLSTNGPQTKSSYTGGNADVTAALLRLHGNDGAASTLGEVAELVEERNGTPTGSACVSAKTGGMSAKHMSTLLSEATDQAGPYTLNVTTSSSLLRVGASVDLVGRVTSAKGKGVPNIEVAFDVPSKDVELSSKSAYTDSSGNATVQVTLKTAHDGTIPASAQAKIASGLIKVSQKDSVDALVLGPPGIIRGSGQIAITTKANPVLSASFDSPAVAVGVPITPTVSVSGMNGHSGSVSMTMYGPLAVPSGGLCSVLTAADWQNALKKDSGKKLVVQTSSADIVGDSVVRADPYTPARPGCFALTASVTTSDSEPNVTRRADFGGGGALITILDTTVTAALDHSGVIGVNDPMSLTLTVAKSHGWTTSVAAKLEGPAAIPINGCGDADWSKVQQVWSDTFQTTGDGKQTFKSAPLAKVGCYRLTGEVRLDTGNGLQAHWPLQLPNGITGVLVLKPRILEALPDATSAVVPKTINDNVFVSGLAGQPGKLTIELYQAPWGGTPGCANIDWSKAKKVATGKPVALTGDGWHAAPSPATSAAGCVSLVPVITLDANSAVTARGSIGAKYSAIIVAAPEAKPFSLKQTKTRQDGYLQSHAAVVGGLLLGAIAFAAIVATLFGMTNSRWAERRDDAELAASGGSPFVDEGGASPFTDADTGEIQGLVGPRRS